MNRLDILRGLIVFAGPAARARMAGEIADLTEPHCWWTTALVANA